MIFNRLNNNYSNLFSLFLSLSLSLSLSRSLKLSHTHTLLRKKRATTKSAKNIDLPQVTGADVTGVAEVHGLTDHRAVNARSPKHNIHYSYFLTATFIVSVPSL